MHFLTKGGVGEVRGNQVTAQKCYVASLKGEPTPKEAMSVDSLEVRDERTWIVTEQGGELEDIILDVKYPDHVIRVGSDLSKNFEKQL